MTGLAKTTITQSANISFSRWYTLSEWWIDPYLRGEIIPAINVIHIHLYGPYSLPQTCVISMSDLAHA